MREIGDRFKRYDRQAEEDDRRARRVDTRSVTSTFTSFSDMLPQVFEKAADKLEGIVRDDLKSKPAPVHFASELAIEHARKRADFLGLSPQMFEVAVQRGMAAVHKGAALCDSPIEKRLLPWLIFEDYGPLLTFPAVLHDAKEEKEVPKGDIMVVPQFAFAKFRIDFGLVARWKKQTKIVAVECDGEGYHGAQRDHWRDQYLRSWGVETVRASGAELHAKPRTVSCRAAALIADWATEL